ncbi:nucleotidyltransferase domain-containing protein [Sunxiuqinia dokdonensis]|nr:nucleotidyltransferase domain-containing protein [Sunxiuqinia dokdonensis]
MAMRKNIHLFFLILGMRISQQEINIIKEIAKQSFGEGTEVLLFGSRIFDQKKGGDIDLLIRNEDKTKLTLSAKIDFLVELKGQIGDQKIDVILDNDASKRKTNFYHSATIQAIKL